ncbi:MAG: AgrD family cyclic lactone autoinducer peptide [Roseburia inulinivorans]
MKQVNKKVLKVVERVMRNEAVYGINGFPPVCLGILHQPKRPIIQKKSEEIVNWRVLLLYL